VPPTRLEGGLCAAPTEASALPGSCVGGGLCSPAPAQGSKKELSREDGWNELTERGE
jgi:hypothetical protein